MNDEKGMNDWLKDWNALQGQYFNAWSELAQKLPQGSLGVNPAMGGFSPAGLSGFAPFSAFSSATPGMQPAWQDGSAPWMRWFADAGKQNDTAERMLESAKSFVAMMQSMYGAIPAGSNGENSAQAWLEAARNAFGTNTPGFDPAAHPFAKALRDVLGKGAQGFSELPAAFAPHMEQLRKEGLSWLQMPAFGLAREHQEHYQRSVLAVVEYQQALREYNRLMLKVSQRGNELFESKLAERSEPGRTIDSLKALYDLWVDAMEDAYAEVALSKEFSHAYGNMANAQMRVRKQVQAEVERISRELGMPTRGELDSLGKRVHDLRRELRDGGMPTDTEIQADLHALRDEVAVLKQALAQAKKGDAVATHKAAAVPAAQAKTVKPEPVRGTTRAARARVATKSRVPAAVVRPRQAQARVGASKADSFADAVAAMQRRVKSKPTLRAASAKMNKPSKSDNKQGKKGSV